MKTRTSQLFLGVVITSLLLNLSLQTAAGKNLTLLQTINPENYELLDVEIEQNLMIIPGGLGGSILYDISDFEAPNELGSLPAPACQFHRAYKWDIEGDLAIGTSRDCGMTIYDISTPSNVQFITHFNPNTAPQGLNTSTIISLEDVEIVDDFAFFAARTHGILIYNISNPQHPEFVSQVPTTNAWSLILHEDIAYIADNAGGLKVIDFSDIENAAVIGSHPTTGAAKDIKYKDGLVFLAVGANGLDIFRIVRPHLPELIVNTPTNGFASRVALDSNRVYISAWQEIEVFEMVENQISRTGYKNTGGRVMAVGTPGDRIIYSAEWGRLQVFEYGPVSDPDIDIDPRSLSYAAMDSVESDTMAVTIENNGGTVLEFYSLATTHSDFNYFPNLSTIEQGGTRELHVVYTAEDDNASGDLFLVTNDPDEPTTSVELIGRNSHRLEVGDPAPEFTLPTIANSNESHLGVDDFNGNVILLTFFASW